MTLTLSRSIYCLSKVSFHPIRCLRFRKISLSNINLCAASTPDSSDAKSNSQLQSSQSTSGAKELIFHTEFVHSSFHLHMFLLSEANLKHGVFLNVPPQSPPEGKPPSVPMVISSSALSQWLERTKLAYLPTHSSPPLTTCGTRELRIDLMDQIGSSLNIPTSVSDAHSARSASASDSGSIADSSAYPVIDSSKNIPSSSMKYHCSLCGKAFRLLSSANNHLQVIHPGASGTIHDGPGPGMHHYLSTSPPSGDSISSRAVDNPAPSSIPAEKNNTLGISKAAPSISKPSTDTPTFSPSKPAPTKLLSLTTTPQHAEIPTDTEVDSLLLDIWNLVGENRLKNSFEPFLLSNIGIADKRSSGDGDKGEDSLFRATPTNAAPGIRRLGKSNFLNVVANSREGGDKSNFMAPMKVRNTRYPNPFANSPNALLMAEQENEPQNPFTNDASSKDTNTSSNDDDVVRSPSSPDLSRAATLRRFSCPECKSCFRLLDALMDHVENVHQRELTENERLMYLEIDKIHPMNTPPEASAVPETTTVHTKSENKSPTFSLSAQIDIKLHARAHGNIVLLGTVEDIQQGFVQNLPVLQFVVRTCGEINLKRALKKDPVSKIEENNLSNQNMKDTLLENSETMLKETLPQALQSITNNLEVGLDANFGSKDNQIYSGSNNEEAETNNPQSDEWITVRCIGTFFTTTSYISEVRPGKKVVVHGVLKMNRHLDKETDSIHPYPFVQVESSSGSVYFLS